MNARISILALFIVVFATACATVKMHDSPSIQTIIEVTGLKESERALLETQVCGLKGVENCKRVTEKRKGQEVTKLVFGYSGSLSTVRWHLDQFKQPGLKAQGAQGFLTFNGFDNVSPTVELTEPPENTVLTDKNVLFAVHVPDEDIKRMTIRGKKIKREDGGMYFREMKLKEGKSTIKVEATDQAGNSTTVERKVEVDTLPPTLKVKVEVQGYDKAIIRGKMTDGKKLLMDDKPVILNMSGEFEITVKRDPDKTQVVLVAFDEHGNGIREVRSLANGARLKRAPVRE